MNHSPLRWLTSGISQWDPDICHKISWKTSQASGLYSLVTEVDQPGTCGDIWNHHSVSSINKMRKTAEDSSSETLNFFTKPFTFCQCEKLVPPIASLVTQDSVIMHSYQNLSCLRSDVDYVKFMSNDTAEELLTPFYKTLTFVVNAV